MQQQTRQRRQTSHQPSEQKLFTLLQTSFLPDKFTSRKFLPANCIDQIVTEGLLDQIFQNHTEDHELVRFVINKPAKKIVATCVLCNLRNVELYMAVQGFMKCGVGDEALPITDQTLKKVPFFGDTVYEPEQPWTDTAVRLFRENQWLFLAPVFSNHKVDISLLADHPFPFVEFHKNMYQGTFGTVHKVLVHDAHQENDAFSRGVGKGWVALKEMKKVNTDTEEGLQRFKDGLAREIQAHKDLQTLKHLHIIEFITAIRKDEDDFLMFLWANGGNLREFWQNHPRPKLTAGLIRDVVEQFRGIIDGLDHLHNFETGSYVVSGDRETKVGAYRHGDIKPENILRVITTPGYMSGINIGTLKIADMGLSKLHTAGTEFGAPTTTTSTTIRYQPPEVHDPPSDRGRSRRYDIWSMGCVMLELIIWLLYGNETLKDFNEKWVTASTGSKDTVPYFERDIADGAFKYKVHSKVTDTMENIAQDPECQKESAIRDLLILVRARLLVVPLGASSFLHWDSAILPSESNIGLGRGGSRGRANTQEILLELDRILEKGTKNDSYWFTGFDRGTIKPLQPPRSKRSNSLYAENVPRVKSVPATDGGSDSNELTLSVPVLTHNQIVRQSGDNLDFSPMEID